MSPGSGGDEICKGLPLLPLDYDISLIGEQEL
jgi:hypothetical protein